MAKDNYQKNFCHLQSEEKLYEKWTKKKLFVTKTSSQKEKFSIIMPPPNVTGTLHIGHALNMTLQDILARYWRMNNKDVLWQPGTDHAGIATQNVVEKKLYKEKKINKNVLGKEKFIAEIWKWKKESGEQIINQIKKLGASPDWNRLKFTLDKDMSEVVNYAFVKLYKKKLIYKDKRLINWDIKLQTAISDLEVEQRESEGIFVYIKYFIENSDNYIVVATTRPETLFGDVCIAVNPSDKRYNRMIGKNVRLPISNNTIPIIADKYVDIEKGTGALKVTPGHDFNDYKIGLKHKFKPVTIFDKKGKFNELVPKEYQNMDRLEAREKIINELKQSGNFLKSEKIKHFVPYGDRSNTVIEPYLTDQWFLDVHKMAQDSVAQVRKKNTVFVPNNWTKTFYLWMKDIEPWCISRQIWWGHQLPVWYGPDQKKFVAESDKAASILAKKYYKKNTKLIREKDVLDTWFSSSLWPMSTLGWPKKNIYFKNFFPTSVLVTGFDIIFFWVARMLMQSIFFCKKVPFKKIYIHALIRDKNGQKMSKSKGNVIDPLEIIKKYGADPLRFTLTLMAAQGRDIRLSEEAVKINRNFVTKVWNAYNFLKKNKCIKKGIKYNEDYDLDINVWALQHLNEFIKNIDKSLKEFRFNDAAREIYKFTKNIYCDWYLEFIKIYLQKNEYKNIQEELKHCSLYIFISILKIAHPIMPFFTDELYYNKMKNKKFLLEESWPKKNKLERSNAKIRGINHLISFISKIRQLRTDLKIEPKQLTKVISVGSSNNKLNYLGKNVQIINNLARVTLLFQDKPAKLENKKFIKFVHKNDTFFIEIINANKKSNFKDIEILKSDLNKVEKEIERLRIKLDNKNFIKKAPQEIIKLTKAKLKSNLESKNKILLEIKS